MTRKDYVAIAAALFRSPDDLAAYTQQKRSPVEIHAFLAYHVSDALAEDNPRFDRQRFLTACGVAQ